MFEKLTRPFPWYLYSKKMMLKIDSPKAAGIFTKEEADERSLRLVIKDAGSVAEGNYLQLYWLVDRDDGAIVDVRFQAYGQSVLIGAAQGAAELLIGKNYDQAKRITADLIDKQLRDKENEPAFPKESHPHLELVITAIGKASEACSDLPLPELYVAPPVPRDLGEVLEGGYPGWKELSLKKKLAVIEEVLDREIRPYIALDAGGIEVINLVNDKEVTIVYQGSCTSCYSSIGTTLSFIQQMLRAKVHPEIVVIPDVDPAKFKN